MRGWAIVWLDDGATADSPVLRSWLAILQTGITHSIISTRRNTFSLHVKCPLLLPDFNQNWNMPTKFSEVLELLHVYWWRVSDFNGRSVGLWTRQNGRMEDNRTVSDFELHSKLPIFTIWRLSQCVFFPPHVYRSVGFVIFTATEWNPLLHVPAVLDQPRYCFSALASKAAWHITIKQPKNINKLRDRSLDRGDEWFADIRPAVFMLLFLQWEFFYCKYKRKHFILKLDACVND